MKRIRETEDIDEKINRSVSIGENYQSFVTGGSKKFLNLTLPEVQIKGKELYKKQPYCTICFRNFTTTFRQHHCRVCVNAVCGDCSRSMVNKERACDLCILRLSNPQEEKKKKEMLDTLQTLCAYLLYRKKMKMQELETLKYAENPDKQTFEQELKKQEKQIETLEAQNQLLKQQKELAEKQMDQVRSRNTKLEESISKIQTELSGFKF